MLQAKIVKKIRVNNGILLYLVKAIKEDHSPNLWTYYILRHCSNGIKTLDRTHSRNRALQTMRVLQDRIEKNQDLMYLRNYQSASSIS